MLAQHTVPSRLYRRHFILALFLFATYMKKTLASPGDRSPIYRRCLQECSESGCAGPGALDTDQLHCASACQGRSDPYLTLFGWNCEANCKYMCMVRIEKERHKQQLAPLKYHGKWPFIRVAGMQEVASVVTSLLNLVAHIYGVRMYIAGKSKRHANEACSPYSKLWWPYIGISCNSWIWSALFHSRDTAITERLDYLSAIAVVMCGLFVCVARTLGVTRWQHVSLLAGATALGWLLHTRYMLVVKFDYGWNMRVCIACGLFQSVLWLVWAFAGQHPARLRLLLFVLAANAALLLEVLDFPPVWGYLDAHSLWHAATAPLTLLWYGFLIVDDAHLTRQAAHRVKVKP